MERFRPAIAPGYLFLSLLLGGSSQGFWGSAILQLLAVVIISWVIVGTHQDSLPKPARRLLVIVTLSLLIVVSQLVPLPLAIWTALPGREFIAEGFQILGIAFPSLSISLAPYDSLETALALLPPLGMLAALLGLRGYRVTWLAGALIAGATAGVLLGIMQVSSPNPEQSAWYPYRISNFGVATGFFANSNHMANLLLVTMPFVAALGATLRRRSADGRMKSAGLAVASAGLTVAVVGLALNRSLAGYALGVPTLLASLIILFGLSAARVRGAAIAIIIAGFVGLALIWARPIVSHSDSLGAETSMASRQQIAANSLRLAKEFAPAGSGLGTFAKLYPRTEDPTSVDRFYVNHVHNDYLELAVETGLAGVLVIIFFLWWWGGAVFAMLRSPAADEFAMAGAVASAAILLHSLADYPLRTSAISVVFAMCLALIIQSRRIAQNDADLRPTRHLVLD